MDANFRDEASRRMYIDAATRWGVPAVLLVCEAAPKIVRKRLANRRDDASDADWSVYLKAAESWEGVSPRTKSVLKIVDTGSSLKTLDLSRHECIEPMEPQRMNTLRWLDVRCLK